MSKKRVVRPPFSHQSTAVARNDFAHRITMSQKMNAFHSTFQPFAAAFVRKYWETIKSGAFPMPPDEPVEESIEEILSDVSHQTELRPAADHGVPSYLLRMTSTDGFWWLFTFRDGGRGWELVEATASSDSQTPHELLGPVYAHYFEPFLQHVTKAANDTNDV